MANLYNTWVIAFELEQMRDYLNITRNALADYEQKLEDKYSIDDLENMDEEAEDEYEKYIDTFSSLMGDFPRRLYTSFVLSWYSFVEDSLTQLCMDMHLTVILSFKDEEGLGSGVLRARRFLAETGEVDTKSKLWKELDVIRRIRNQIVHENGKFQTSQQKPNKGNRGLLVKTETESYYLYLDQQLYYYLVKHSLLHYYNTAFIFPSFEYCHYLVDFGETFFTNLFEELKLR